MLTANDISVDTREHILRLYTERVNVLEIAGIVKLPVEVVTEVIQASKRHRERELLPQRGRGGTGARIRATGIVILSSVMRQVNDTTRHCRIKFNAAGKLLTIQFDPTGPWTLTRFRERDGRETGGRVGGSLLVQELLNAGIEFGLYPATVRDGNTVVVNLNRKIR